MAKRQELKVVEIEEAFDKKAFEIRWIPVGKLCIKYAESQRRMKNDNHAKSIAGSFDPDLFGVLAITQPTDTNGMHHVIDGYNRRLAVQMLWGDNECVPCEILPTKDPVRAAQIFMGRNTHRRNVSALQRFKVGVKAEFVDNVIINKIVKSAGYRVDEKKEGTIAAVASLQYVYRRFGPDVLKDTLMVIQGTWGMDTNAVAGPIISGYGEFLSEFANKANWGRLTSVMAKEFTPGKLIGAAKSYRDVERGMMTECVKKVIVSTYDKGLKAGRLKTK